MANHAVWFVVVVLLIGTGLSKPAIAQRPVASTTMDDPALAVTSTNILDTSTPDAYFGVTLTEQQRTQLFAIRATYTPQLKAIVEKGRTKTLPPDSVRAQLQRITEARQRTMRAVLTCGDTRGPDTRPRSNWVSLAIQARDTLPTTTSIDCWKALPPGFPMLTRATGISMTISHGSGRYNPSSRSIIRTAIAPRMHMI